MALRLFGLPVLLAVLQALIQRLRPASFARLSLGDIYYCAYFLKCVANHAPMVTSAAKFNYHVDDALHV